MGWFSKAVKKAANVLKKTAAILGVVAGAIGGSVAASQPAQSCVKVDQKVDFVVALVKLKDGKLYAIPSNALPASMRAHAIPSNAIPANAIPANALPASAIPSNAIPSNTLARELLESQAIPSNAIPSNITTTNLQNGVVNITRIWTQLAIPSNAIPSNFILFPYEGYLEDAMPVQLAGIGIGGVEEVRPETLFQTKQVARSSWLCQGEFVPSLQTKTCNHADLLPSARQKCEGGTHFVVLPLTGSFAASLAPLAPTASSSTGGTAGGSSGGGGGGGSSGAGGTSGSECSEVYEGFTVYTGGLSESSLVIFLRIEGGATYEGTSYSLNVTPGSDQEFECSLVEGHRLYCAGTHPGTKPLTVSYELVSNVSGCSITAGSLYLDYGAASSSQGNEAGQEIGGSSGNETGQEFGDNGCLAGDVLDGHGLCCAESDYDEEWDSCNEPTYNPED